MSRAAELRASFDRSFAEALVAADRPHVDLLAVRLGGERFALAVREIASVHVDLHVARVPTSAMELLGVASIRAAIVPVYDLRIVLGTTIVGAPRWTVVAAEGAAAYSFDGFDGLVRLDSEPPLQRSERGLRGSIEHSGRSIPVVDLPAVSALLRDRWIKEP